MDTMTIEKIKDMVARGELREHHTASERGYLSRKGGCKIENYSGKFGTGYKVAYPRFDTTQYVTITYYIKA